MDIVPNKENIPSFHIGTSDPVNNRRRSTRRRSTSRRSTSRRSTRRRSTRLASSAHIPSSPLKHGRDIENQDANTRSKKKRKVMRKAIKKKKKKKKRKTAREVLSELEPSFAMMPVGFQEDHVLDTGYGGEWKFDLGERLSQIHEQCPNLDLYVVGYRVEERPGVTEDGFRDAFPYAEEGKRIKVPYFAVHALPRDLDEPDTIVLEDIELKTTKFKKLSELSLYWTQVVAFEDSPAVVKLLQSKARTTETAKRACHLPPEHVGGSVYFPQRPKCLRNHGEAFSFALNGEDFPFDDSIWGWTKQDVKSAITNDIPDHDKKRFWLDFMMTEDTNDWLEKVLPKAIDRFYEYYDGDIDRKLTEDDVRDQLEHVFIAFRSNLINDNWKYTDSEDALKQCTNFKIYPENDFLQVYLGKGGVNKLSKWIPGNGGVFVYPIV